MLGLIAFTAMLHIALGYGLAIYLGYVPDTSGGNGNRPSAAPTQFASLIDDDDIVIPGEDPIDEPIDPTNLAESGATGGHSASNAEADMDAKMEPMSAETAESMNSDAQSPSSDRSSEEAISDAVDRLFGLAQRIRDLLIECAEDVFAPDNVGNTASPGPVSALAFTSGAIGQEIGRMAPHASTTDRLGLRVGAIWEHFNRQMAEFTDSPGASLAGSPDVAETDRTRWLTAVDATFKLRDSLASVRFELAQRESWIAQVDETARIDEETGLPNAPGIAIEYAALQRSTTKDGNLVVALLDIDDCHRLNASLGPIACSELIVHIAEIVRTTLGDAGQIGRMSGQRFAVLLPGFLPNAATDEIERIRETLCATTFQADGDDHRVTMTCGLAEAAPRETASELMNRLEETLAEAKRYGKDRTFLHEGEFPAPVIPPKINVEPRNITLTSVIRTTGAISEADQ